jgi:hypothetical protein
LISRNKQKLTETTTDSNNVRLSIPRVNTGFTRI